MASALPDEIEISIGGGDVADVVPLDSSSSSSTMSSFLSNLFDPSIVDVDITYAESPEGGSETVPKFAPPSVIMIEEIDETANGYNGSISVIEEGEEEGGVDPTPTEYEHDVYFVLVVVTVSLTVLVMVTFAIYRIIEASMDGSIGCRRRRQSQQSGTATSAAAGTSATSAIPPGQPPPTAITDHPQGFRATSVEFLSGFFTFSRPPNGRPSSGTLRRRDAPPPYDDPPPYHIAIGMDKEVDARSSNSNTSSSQSEKEATETPKPDEDGQGSSNETRVPQVVVTDADDVTRVSVSGDGGDETDGRRDGKMRVVSVLVV